MTFPEKQNTEKLHPNQIVQHHRFAHNAMHTRFEILIAGGDKNYAAQAAAEAFRLLNGLESALSHFLPGSDISRINAASSDQPVCVGLDAFTCLKSCRDLWKQTGGLFDVTIGALFHLWRKMDHPPSAQELREAQNRTGMDRLSLNEADFTVTPKADHIELDLGGYGKGYAVDRMAESLREWDIGAALIHGGASSVLAFGEDAWPVSITNPWTEMVRQTIKMNNTALGASGLQKGQHILNPKTGRPVSAEKAVWIMAENAATADALSTTLMLLSQGKLNTILKNFENTNAFVLWKDDNREETFGNWPK